MSIDALDEAESSHLLLSRKTSDPPPSSSRGPGTCEQHLHTQHPTPHFAEGLKCGPEAPGLEGQRAQAGGGSPQEVGIRAFSGPGSVQWRWAPLLYFWEGQGLGSELCSLGLVTVNS